MLTYATRYGTLIVSAVLLAGSLTACDSSNPDDEEVPSLTGTWVGTMELAADTLAFRFVLTEGTGIPLGGKSLSGTGNITSTAESVDFPVTGSYTHPLISLTFAFSDRPIGTLSGNVNEARDRITATVTGPGIGGLIELRVTT